jgi:RNA polymerase subunit RPABC4/transcription elongation factor Spt4
MTKITTECRECGVESTIEFDADNVDNQPEYCPFCGSSYIEEELEDDLDLLKNGGFDDDMDIQW